jgi:hypothetical protein
MTWGAEKQRIPGRMGAAQQQLTGQQQSKTRHGMAEDMGDHSSHVQMTYIRLSKEERMKAITRPESR